MVAMAKANDSSNGSHDDGNGNIVGQGNSNDNGNDNGNSFGNNNGSKIGCHNCMKMKKETAAMMAAMMTAVKSVHHIHYVMKIIMTHLRPKLR